MSERQVRMLYAGMGVARLDALRAAATLAVGRKGSAVVAFAADGFSSSPLHSTIQTLNAAPLNFKLEAATQARASCSPDVEAGTPPRESTR